MIITNDNIKDKYIDSAGKWRVLLGFDEYNVILVKFNHDPTLEELQIFADKWEDFNQHSNIKKIEVSVYDYIQNIEDAVRFIKETPSLNLTKWNNYLDTLSLEISYVIKWFIFVMARKLSEINNLTLDNLTELEVLGKMKTWFINTPERKIKKIFYGE